MLTLLAFLNATVTSSHDRVSDNPASNHHHPSATILNFDNVLLPQPLTMKLASEWRYLHEYSVPSSDSTQKHLLAVVLILGCAHVLVASCIAS
jgi:hypothetical protein